MKLSDTTTRPSNKACLEFTEGETIEALKEYAIKQGYTFDGDIWITYPWPSHEEKTISLLIDNEKSAESAINQVVPPIVPSNEVF